MHVSEATLLLLDQRICQPHTTLCPLSVTEDLPSQACCPAKPVAQPSLSPSQACPSSCPTKLWVIIKSLLFSIPISWAVIIPQCMVGTPLNPQGWNLLAFSVLLFALHTLIETRCSDQEHGSCSQASWSPSPTQWTTSWVASGYSAALNLSVNKVKILQSCPILRPHGLYSPWNSPVQNSGVGSCSLLQGIFPTLGSNPGLLHCRQILYQLCHHENPKFQRACMQNGDKS